MRMIQPVNALTPRAGFRGSNDTVARKNKGATESQVALINAAGIATAAGGLTTLVARSYTNSFAHAGVLGVFGAFLTMFFMTPHLIEKFGINKMAAKATTETVDEHRRAFYRRQKSERLHHPYSRRVHVVPYRTQLERHL